MLKISPNYTSIDEWKDKDEFISWVEEEKNRLLQFEKDAKNKKLELFKTIHNRDIKIEVFEMYLDENIIKYLNKYGFKSKKLSVQAYSYFLETIEELEFFEKSGMSTHKGHYDRKVNILKNNADKLQFYSTTQITIRIPTLPQLSLSRMKFGLKLLGVSEDDRKILHDYLPYSDTETKTTTIKEFINKTAHKYRYSLFTYSPLKP